MNNLKRYLSEEEFKNVKDTKDLYEKAYSLVTILFKDKVDKENQPYIGHLIRVSNNVENKDTKVAALLHDTIEDIDYITKEDLIEIGFNENILEIVLLVTKDKIKKESYHNKITKIINSGNIEAIKLKYADMSDNFDPERLSRLDEATRKKLSDKYKDEIIRLEEKIKEV